jgi:hypothetical protein
MVKEKINILSYLISKRKHNITLTTVMFFHFVMFTFWNYYVLKLLRLETITFSDATLGDINVLSQYLRNYCILPLQYISYRLELCNTLIKL